MKKWKIILVMICMLSLFGYTKNIHAQDAGYVYDRIHVDVTVNDAREYHVTETMDIDFEESMHGIIRNIPKSGDAERFEVKKIQVEGMPFTVNEKQNEVDIKIGDADETVYGKKRITLSYTLKHYQDYDPNYDYIYINLLGTDYDTQVKEFSADVTFPSQGELLNYRMTSGSTGSTGNHYVKGTLDGNKLHVTSNDTIPSSHGVTLQMKFEEGIFSSAPEYQFPYIIKNNQMKISVTSEQDFYVEQELVLDIKSPYTQITLPMIQDLWDEDSYQLKDIKISDDDITYNRYDSLHFYAKKEEERQVTISYVVHPYRIQKDKISLNLFQKDDQVKMQAFSLQLTTPSAPNTSFTLGRQGDEIDTNRINQRVEDTSLYLSINEPVLSGDEFHLNLDLKAEDYHRGTSIIIYIALGITAGFMVLLLILRFVILKPKEIIAPVNFYPPKGMNPADAGYVIDLHLSDTDITAMIFYWADKGYLKIKYQGSSFCFEQVKDIDPSAPDYERQLFYGMFSHGTNHQVNKVDLQHTFYLDVKVAKRNLKARYQGKWALRNPSVEILRKLLMVASIIPFLLLNTLSQYEVYGDMLKAFIQNFTMLPIFIYIFLFMKLYQNYQNGNTSKGAMIAVFIIFGGMFVLPSFLFIFLLPDQNMYALIGLFCSIIALWLSHGIHLDSPYRQKLLSSLLGFKDFIKTVEKDRLEMLLEDDPEYYYHILPYANVLHVSDIWEQKFRSITIPAPTWYDSDEVFRYAVFHHMVHDINQDIKAVSTPPRSSGGSSSGNFGDFSGGGGGFSSGGSVGGGSGGGGSHGW